MSNKRFNFKVNKHFSIGDLYIFMRNVYIKYYSYFMATGNRKSAKVARFEECYNSIHSEADQPSAMYKDNSEF